MWQSTKVRESNTPGMGDMITADLFLSAQVTGVIAKHIRGCLPSFVFDSVVPVEWGLEKLLLSGGPSEYCGC